MSENTSQEQVSIELKAGDETDSLIQFIFNNMSDDDVDQIDLKRVHNSEGGVASEALTTSAILTLSVTTITVIGRLVEKWIESERQAAHLEILIKAHKEIGPQAEALTALANKHADVVSKAGFLELESESNRGSEGSPRSKGNSILVLVAIVIVAGIVWFFW